MNQKEILMLALKEKFNSLPERLQNAITDSDYQNKLLTISQKYKITVEQLGALEQETSFVLLGITLARDYASDLKSQLKLDDTTLNSIIADVNAEIFIKIKDVLMEIEEGSDAEEKTKMESDKQDEKWADEMSEQIKSEKGGEQMKEESKIKAESREEIVEKREDLLAHIENPPAGGGLNLAMLKMTKPVVGEVNKSANVNMNNLSTPGNNPPISTPPKSSDPYREMPE